MKSVGVVLLTYNPDIEKLKHTLKSIVLQRNIDFELVIADDGSRNDVSEMIVEYLTLFGFNEYKFVSHSDNQGTVKNLFDGVKECDSEYIKVIGQGDMLFDETTLYDLYSFSRENDAEVCVSKYINFRMDREKIDVISKPCFPQYIKAFDDPNLLRKFYLLFGDVAIGASIFYQKKTLNKYLNEIYDKVLFAEDFMIMLMVYDRQNIVYYSKNTVWYENGSGISQVSSDKWKDRIRHDWVEISKMLISRCENDNTKFSKHLKNRINSYYQFLNKPGIVTHVQYLMSTPGLMWFSIKNKFIKNYTDTSISIFQVKRYIE